ncbi:hypothetical protein [Olivibacter sitiensis]|uniref:hypothetical protein n=1 Tax=Olivibacter sitiensis TaxID=376470 RepID=UPI00041F5BB2|nr:hypothetical protein [Olivibacter sitiensis]
MEDDTMWKMDSSFFGENKYLLTSYPIDDTTLAVSNQHFLAYVYASRSGLTGGGYLSSKLSIPVAPSLSKSFGINYIDSQTLRFFPIRRPTNSASVFYSPTYSDALFSQKSFPVPLYGRGYPIVGNRALIPIEIMNNEAILHLMEVYTGIDLSMEVIKEIVLTPHGPDRGFESFGYYSYAFFDRYFIMWNAQLYRIDNDGNVKSFGSSFVPGEYAPHQIFQLREYLFAITDDALLISIDQGENWSTYIKNISQDLLRLTYQNIGDELYGFSGSQIVKFSMDGESIVFYELENKGLETHHITSINKLGNYYYTTTLSGLFYKDAEYFLTQRVRE